MKLISVREFNATSGPTPSGELIIAYRRKGTLYLQNLGMEPKDRFKVAHNAGLGTITIEITINEAECLTIGDLQGQALKTQVEGT